MSEFKNVTAVKEANIYFEGKVTSRTLIFRTGPKKHSALCSPGNMNSVQPRRKLWKSFQGSLMF